MNHAHRAAAALLALALLSGCASVDFSAWPRASSASPAPASIEVLIPEDCDACAASALQTIAEKASSLSGGAVQVTPRAVTSPLAEYLAGGQAALLSLSELCSVDADLEVLDCPFLFSGTQLFSVFLNSGAGGLYDGVLRTALAGDVICAFPTGSAGILSSGAPELSDSLAGCALAVSPALGVSVYEKLGAESVTVSADPLADYAAGAVTEAEAFPDRISDALPAQTFYATGHRRTALFLVLRTSGDGAADASAADFVREGAAYALPLAEDAAAQRESAALERLRARGVRVVTGDFVDLYYAASDLYRDRYLDLGLTRDVYDKVYTLLS